MTVTATSTTSTVSRAKRNSTPTSASSGTAAPSESPTPSSPSKIDEAVSLYALGTQLQVLGSEINAAAELLETDDPELQAEGITLLEQYLAVQESTTAALSAKADRLLIFCDHKIQRSAFLKAQAKRLKEHADREDALVTKLQEYLIKVLTTLHPDETRFSFDTHELTSRKSTVVDIDADLDPQHDLPEEYVRTKTTYEPDKAAIKEALKARKQVPGCSLIERRSWTVQ